MQVKQNKKDDLNLTVNITLEKGDYVDIKKKKLNDFRRKADIKGFRKGMAPMSLIEKIHGHSALADAINQVVTDQLNKFIEDNKLNIIGEPLPSETENKNDWENGETFTFDFDIALSPQFKISVTKEDAITYYDISVTAKAQKELKSNLLKQYGTLEKGEQAKEDDFLIVDFEQGETKVENAYVALRSIEDEKIKAKFIGKKAGDSMNIDVNKTFKNETDRASMLKLKKEDLASLDPKWKMNVKEVKTFVDAEPQAEVFDKMFGEGVVKTEEEFDAKIKERLVKEYAQESDYRFSIDAQEYLINKSNISLPEEFIKRWLFTANEGKFTKEDIDKEFQPFIKDFRWQMIRGRIMQEQKLKVSKEDLINEAQALASYQFAMYGMSNVPQEQLVKFAENILADEQQGRRIYEKVENDLVIGYIRNTVTLEKKKITLEKIREISKQ